MSVLERVQACERAAAGCVAESRRLQARADELTARLDRTAARVEQMDKDLARLLGWLEGKAGLPPAHPQAGAGRTH